MPTKSRCAGREEALEKKNPVSSASATHPLTVSPSTITLSKCRSPVQQQQQQQWLGKQVFLQGKGTRHIKTSYQASQLLQAVAGAAAVAVHGWCVSPWHCCHWRLLPLMTVICIGRSQLLGTAATATAATATAASATAATATAATVATAAPTAPTAATGGCVTQPHTHRG